MGKKIIKVPPNFEHPKDSARSFIPGAHYQLLASLPPEQLTHFQIYETVSEGTPVSPVFSSQQALDDWLTSQSKNGVNSSQLADIGRTMLVRRVVPGAQAVKGREFMYIEISAGETFHQLVARAFADQSRPNGGGGEEKVRIKLKDGSSLIAVSFKGDIDGWRAGFVGLCVASGRRYGSIREGRLYLSDRFSALLEELEISFE